MQKLMILLLCMLMIVPVMAQEDEETPANSPSQNWCFDGGPLEGKCGLGDTAESQWMWLHGFYSAQVANGTLLVIDIPEEYRGGLTDRTFGGGFSGSSATKVFYDGDGNVIASGTAQNFVGYIVSCRFGEKSTDVFVGWQGLEVPGDRIEVGTPSGAGSTSTYIPLSQNKFRLKFGDPIDRIEEDGTMNIYREGYLIGTSDLNGLNECEDTTG